jgi:hypothetical protein
MSDTSRDNTSGLTGAGPGGAGTSSNPFSTRHVRPGALPYVFPPEGDLHRLVARLQANHWWGQIIGPHGSGKSTLLATLTPALARAGRDPRAITLHDGERSLAAHSSMLEGAGANSIVIVDGYEQLSRLRRWRLKRFCRRRASGLLVTSHTPVGLPPLAITAVDERTAEAVLRLLVPQPGTVGRDDLLRALAAHPGDLRETLFELYDVYEARRIGP